LPTLLWGKYSWLNIDKVLLGGVLGIDISRFQKVLWHAALENSYPPPPRKYNVTFGYGKLEVVLTFKDISPLSRQNDDFAF
jgi:hypothetical protein